MRGSTPAAPGPGASHSFGVFTAAGAPDKDFPAWTSTWNQDLSAVQGFRGCSNRLSCPTDSLWPRWIPHRTHSEARLCSPMDKPTLPGQGPRNITQTREHVTVLGGEGTRTILHKDMPG